MELLKRDERPTEFKWKDVTFLFRSRVTAGDRYTIDTAGTVMDGDKVKYTPWEFYKTLIRVFLVGWDGVTEDGKPIPYSFETLLTRFPSENGDDVLMSLGYAIAQATGILKTEEQAKGGEASSPNG